MDDRDPANRVIASRFQDCADMIDSSETYTSTRLTRQIYREHCLVDSVVYRASCRCHSMAQLLTNILHAVDPPRLTVLPGTGRASKVLSQYSTIHYTLSESEVPPGRPSFPSGDDVLSRQALKRACDQPLNTVRTVMTSSLNAFSHTHSHTRNNISHTA